MKYVKSYDPSYKFIWHECSIRSLINIISSSHFEPTFKGKYGYDSCLNCYSEENRNVWNSVSGNGATLKMIWLGEIREVDDNLRTPFPKDILFINHTWRSFIAIKSNRYLCKIVGFEINERNQLFDMFSSSYRILSKIPYLKSFFFTTWKIFLLKRLIRLVDENQYLAIK
jgi:hypothetical protein